MKSDVDIVRQSGLRQSDIDEIRTAAQIDPNIVKISLFGSRALGTFRPGSDVDMVIDVTDSTIRSANNLYTRLENYSKMPYFFDIVDRSTITEERFTQHINQCQLEIYSKQEKGFVA